MEFEIFFAVHLKRLLGVDGELTPSVAELEEAFTKHVHEK